MSIKDAYEEFHKTHPEIKIGMTSFAHLKPTNVRKASETSRQTCLCQTCCNLALKLEALGKYVRTMENDENKDVLAGVDTNRKKIVSETLCQNEEGENPKQKCLMRDCQECGVKLLDNYLKPITDINNDTEIIWNKWESISISKDDKIKRCVSCVTKTSSLSDFTNQLKMEHITKLLLYPKLLEKRSHSRLYFTSDNI